MVRREIRKLEQKRVSTGENQSKKAGMAGQDRKVRDKMRWMHPEKFVKILL